MVLRPIRTKIRTCEQATKPQINNTSYVFINVLACGLVSLIQLSFFLQHKSIPEIILVSWFSRFD